MLEAIGRLARHVKVLKASTVYLTEPLLQRAQPSYYNCVLEIETEIDPYSLKSNVLRAIEEDLGRKRTADKFASRTIDIDLILYGNEVISEGELVLPDPDIGKRAWLAIPLREIQPDLVLPGQNKPIRDVAARFEKKKLTELTVFSKRLQSLIASLSM
jgi:2-amino-4-hydroxy-6-hydroxymethyldihydropteridine diphosphokinase